MLSLSHFKKVRPKRYLLSKTLQKIKSKIEKQVVAVLKNEVEQYKVRVEEKEGWVLLNGPKGQSSGRT